MNGSLILLILAVVPMLCAPLAWALGRRGGQRAIAVMIACSAVEVAALIWLTALAAGGNALRRPGRASWAWASACGRTVSVRCTR